MKIIMNDCVYVQKHDLKHCCMYMWNREPTLFFKVFRKDIIMVNDSNRYEFVKFDDYDVIEYFKNLDWIVDYNSVKDLNKIGFVTLGEEIVIEMQKLSNKLNAMSKEELENHLDMVTEYEKLEYKMCSLRDIIWYKQGKIKMTLPEGVEYPRGYVFNNKKRKGLKRILSKFKKH